MLGNWYSSNKNFINKLIVFLLLSAIFYCLSYLSVSSFGPTAVPVHHDDYSNYSLRIEDYSFGVRPLSTFIIAALSSISPQALIWSVRFLTVLYLYLSFFLFRSVVRNSGNWAIASVFAFAVFSSPVMVEYARYTGMITHLISGCLGISAVLALHQAFIRNDVRSALFSCILISASVFSKEDFLLLYFISYIYFSIVIGAGFRVRCVGVLSMLSSGVLIIVFKFFTATAFLGVTDVASTYYVNISPISIARTIVKYLGGGENPVFVPEGYVFTCLFFFSLIFGIFAAFKRNLRPLYFIGCALAVMAPYAILPNHINPYYVYLWTPFICFATLESLALAATYFSSGRLSDGSSRVLAIGVLLVISAILLLLNYPGRLAVANWYDRIATNNIKVFSLLRDNTIIGASSDVVCVIGADAFSPWYMHSSLYIDRVLGLSRNWVVVVPKQSALMSGFEIGALVSQGRFSLSTDKEPSNCTKTIHLEKNEQ